jgi:hypothetical protein
MAMAAKTWSGEWWKLGGGGTVWDAISYDPELKPRVLRASANGLEWARSYRSANKGDNLFLVLDRRTQCRHGRVRLALSGAIRERNGTTTPSGQLTLADLTIDGKPARSSCRRTRNGFFYVLDRKTGKFISAKPYVPQNWASGSTRRRAADRAHGHRYSSTGKSIVMMPGRTAAQLASHGLQPEHGLVYIPAQEIASASPRSRISSTSEIGWNLACGRRGYAGAKKGYLLAWDPVQQKEVVALEYIGRGTAAS